MCWVSLRFSDWKYLDAYSFPSALTVLGSAEGVMQEHQVYIVEFRFGKGRIDLRFGLFVADVAYFGCEEYLVAWNSRCADGVAAAGFVVIFGC